MKKAKTESYRNRFLKLLHLPINSREEAENYIASMAKANTLYHFEDDAATIFNTLTNKPLFSPSQAVLANNRSTELQSLNWEPYADVFDYVIKHFWEEVEEEG